MGTDTQVDYCNNEPCPGMHTSNCCEKYKNVREKSFSLTQWQIHIGGGGDWVVSWPFGLELLCFCFMKCFRKREVNNGTFSPIDNLNPLSENSESAPVQSLSNGGTRKV